MNDRNFYERRLGNPGYDAVASKKIKELEKAVFGGTEMVEKVLYQTDSAEPERYTHAGITELYGWAIDATFDIVVGKTYKIALDGVEYVISAHEAKTPDGFVYACIGNPGLIGNEPDTGEKLTISDDDGLYMDATIPYTRVKITTMEEQSVGGLGGVVRIEYLSTDDGETIISNVTHGDIKRMIEAGEFSDGVYTETYTDPSGNKAIYRVERIVSVFFNPDGDGSITVLVGAGNQVVFPVDGEPFVP